MPPVAIGVISDTHGVLRPEAAAALRSVSVIIHGGDIGKQEVLKALSAIAPVRAVRGNIDVGPWAEALPLTRTVKIGRTKIYVVHNIADLGCNPRENGYGAVISGHSHRPQKQVREGVLYLNPGSAGPRRFRLPVTIARLVVEGSSLSAEITTLFE